MKLRVKLFGTFPSRFPGYQADNGLIFELKEDARVADLLNCMQISPKENCTASINGKIQKATYALKDGDLIKIFPYVAGG